MMQQQWSEEEEEVEKRPMGTLRALQKEARPESESTSAVSVGSPSEVPVAESPHGLGGEDDEDDSDDDGFEFASGGLLDGLEDITADEIFSNGLIRPLYPLFDRALVFDGDESEHQGRDGGAVEAGDPVHLPLRQLLAEERDPPSASSSEADELERIPAGSYCVWKPGSAPPSPDLRRKSHSTGTSASSKPSRLCNLAGRSHSDGKERLVFLAAPQTETMQKNNSKLKKAEHTEAATAGRDDRKGKGKGRVRVTEMDMVTAHRLYYSKGGAAAAGDRRRSFLPYRKDLVGFFSHVNGPGRSFQPL